MTTILFYHDIVIMSMFFQIFFKRLSFDRRFSYAYFKGV
nr:MAG TPA: hypothetical protein [Caudoviricetes sp.]DAQ81490.1 MAG TPA: hypothetical protein [Caudoviricetes sp.]